MDCIFKQPGKIKNTMLETSNILYTYSQKKMLVNYVTSETIQNAQKKEPKKETEKRILKKKRIVSCG